ncbi:UDP-N-acetylmuramate--L-alanine ligase [Salininema proteolyticum]|uniref:UDP-N-acetylmuramate--L-alanine ligase n=1 Tax=Salininema proteolyticum TaxID=1607685 RepID=A0ABV8TUG0_9ACTN
MAENPDKPTSPIDEGITAEDLGNVYLIGVGGVGMNGLTRLYATRGIPTSGAELADWPNLPELERQGVRLHRSHSVDNLDGVDTVVRSTAINDEHMEIKEARERGLRVYHRSEALAAAMTGLKSVVVTGTHGKTTTTAIVTQMLASAGLDPSYVNGGEIIDAHTGAHGKGEHFVAEADESDRSFLRYRPHVGIITNIDADHLNVYGTMSALTAAFDQFALNTDPEGAVVACADDEGTMALARRARDRGRTVITYGCSEEADVRLHDVRSSVEGVTYRVSRDGEELGEVTLPMPGRHIALNSGAAVAAGLFLGLDFDAIARGIKSFTGVRRRFEKRGTKNGAHVYDEYAYHPTAMREAITTLKEVAAPGRLIVVFLPYRVYRTVEFRGEIAGALSGADAVVCMEVFGPGEEIPEGAGRSLLDAVDLPDEAKVFVPEWDDVPAAALELAEPGDLVVTMGAPPISMMPERILEA